MKLKFKPFNKRAFTLIEILFSMLIVSLIIHGMLSFFMISRNVYEKEESDKDVAFSQFLLILEEELSMLKVKEVGADYLRLTDGIGTYKVILQNNKIYKTPGHHPYAYQIQEWQLIDHNDFFEVLVTYTNNQTFYGWVYYEK